MGSVGGDPYIAALLIAFGLDVVLVLVIIALAVEPRHRGRHRAG